MQRTSIRLSQAREVYTSEDMSVAPGRSEELDYANGISPFKFRDPESSMPVIIATRIPQTQTRRGNFAIAAECQP
jgi:hypothetical protein